METHNFIVPKVLLQFESQLKVKYAYDTENSKIKIEIKDILRIPKQPKYIFFINSWISLGKSFNLYESQFLKIQHR